MLLNDKLYVLVATQNLPHGAQAQPSRRNVAVVSHTEYVPTLSALRPR